MKRCQLLLILPAVFCVSFRPNVRAAIDFETEVEPILRDHCFDCHGPDEQEGQLRLDRLSGMREGGNSGEPAVIPGDVDKSYLLKLVRREEPGMAMPPDDELSKQQVQVLESWIAEGATTPARYGPPSETPELTHWAFQPVQRSNSSGIDDSIEKQHARHGLAMSNEADRRTLIRRLYLVMLGLPPTPDEVHAFVHDSRENAWALLVEKVLASPRYGEHCATYWLDLIRYGETNGFETNRERPNAWPFRDWVIRSFNEDKPYDQFVREQLAGDALGEPIGTAFLVAGPYDIVKGQDPKLGQMQRMNELDDMINTTGTAFLGLTTGCARCHNHKFDPIRQADYYAMQAVFAGVRHGDTALPHSLERKQAIEELDAEISELTQKLERFVPPEQLAMIVLDESDAHHAIAPQGQATKPAHQPADFGDSKYTWWENAPGKDIVAYRPKVSGRYRIWISWGAGFPTHCSDAQYVIRSKAGDRGFAVVDQRLSANGEGVVDSVARWSGMYSAGTHNLLPDDEIVLIGGESGSAITADAIILQPSTGDSQVQPVKRPRVNAKENEERIYPTELRRIRFTIEKTNGGEGCLDELEVYAGDQNVALASEGTKATSSGDFVHELHRLEHVNDGQHGNPKSWIVKSHRDGWVQLDFREPALVDRIVWGRDRTGRYADRLTTDYRIEGQADSDSWFALATSSDRYPATGDAARSVYQFEGFERSEAEQGRKWLARLREIQALRADLQKQTIVYAGSFSQPGPTHRLYRGEFDAKRERVAPGTIHALDSPDVALEAPEQARRLAMADWIASENNPLTARVIVNRLWQFHFGEGIVATPSDFGLNGSPPTHPELLDWLASELMTNGWSLKHIHRTILMSRVWRQSNRPDVGALKIDSGTRFLWRFPPRRLRAESIRDSILSVSGVLDLDATSGPGFSPFDVQMENVRHYHAKKVYGPEDWRRMVFMTRVRQEREQVFGVFDCPDASMVVAKRSRSTTPLQALNLLNSGFVMQQAEILSKRLKTESDETEAQIKLAWELGFQRPPTAGEIQDGIEFIRAEGLTQFCRAVLNSNEFVFLP